MILHLQQDVSCSRCLRGNHHSYPMAHYMYVFLTSLNYSRIQLTIALERLSSKFGAML